MKELSQQIANLTPEQRILFEKRLKQKGLKHPQLQSIPKRQHFDSLPLSFAQQRLWFIQQLDPNNYSYNVPSSFRLKGKLEVKVLEQTLNEIVKRHETLRTTFGIDAMKQPIQIIIPFEPFSLPIIDVAESEIQQLAETEFQQPFDLTEPLLRLKLLKLAETDHVLLLTAHHIISDRWSIGVFIREMTLLYSSFAQKKASPLSELSIQYADWAIWQRQRLQDTEKNKQITYWKQQLNDLSILELPTDRPRPVIPTYQGAQYPIILSKSLSDQLRDFGSQEGVTLFTLLLAAFQVLLHRYTHQNDIFVGTEIANRDRIETESLIGLFVNTLVLRINLTGNPTFRELLERVREVILGAFAHQDLPFEKLVEVLNPERNLSQMIPLFQVKFDFQLAPVKPLELAGLSLERLPFDNGTIKYELRFNLQDTEQGISGQIEYSTDLFDEATIQAMVEHWEILLQGIVQKPEQRISELPLLSQTEQQLLFRWNNTQKTYPNFCIHQLFEAQVERTPDAVAVIDGEKTLTYHELNTKSNQLAHYLKKLGVKPEDKIGICSDRTFDLIIGLFGILKAGAAYVPLDPNYPQERINFILEDAQVSVLLVNKEGWRSKNIINFKKNWQTIEQENSKNLKSKIIPQNLAYIIYTSGSTGKPKGVAIEHRNTVQLLHWAKEIFSPDEIVGVLAATSICFDLSVFEIFVPLSWGGKVILAENALALPTLPAANQVTLINTVPSAITQLLQINGIPTSVRTINLAGEALQHRLVQQLKQQKQIEKIYNLYGPSEDTTYSTYALVNQDSVTIGKPIANTQIYILDPYLQSVPISIPGELYISSSGLARGYHNQPEKTALAFVPNPFFKGKDTPWCLSTRLYKTGDKVRYGRDGNLEFLGRLDHQVKIRGYRVEIGEIEAILSQYPTLCETVVTVRKNQSLIAYIVLTEKSNSSQLRRFLEEKLPSYMIPTAFIELEALPRLPNGKVDRKLLPDPDNLRPDLETAYIVPETELEKTITAIWQKALNKEEIGIYDNFFELGGHSLLGMKVTAEMSDVLGISIPLRNLFQKPTVAGLIEQIENTESVEKQQLPKIIPNLEERNQPFPLTDIQQAYLIGRSDAFELGNVATHGYREIETVSLTVAQVEHAFRQLIDRHDMLRVIILEDGQQKILPSVPSYEIQTIDLRGQNPDTTLAEIRERLSHQILKTEQWPLFEIVATLLEENRIRFHISFDVLIGDAWSFQLIGAELAQIIQNLDFILPSISLSFRDYVLAEIALRETELYKASLTYWQNRLTTLPASPELPLEKNLAAITNPRFVRRSGTLEPKTWQRLKQKASQTGITPSGLILAAFAEILTLWSRKNSFTINLTLFNRLTLHPEVNQIIGDFTSSSLLAVDNSEQNSFTVRAKRIQAQLWQDLDHRYVSGVKVLRELARLQGRTTGALMPVVFTSTLTQNNQHQSSLPTEVVYSLSQTSQVYLDHQVSEIANALIFNWDAIEELFPVGVLDDMFATYCDFLEHLANEDDLWEVSTRLLLPSSQIEQITAINRTEEDFRQKDYLLHHLFFEQFSINAQNTAIITSNCRITYQELGDRSLTLAHQLKTLEVQPNQLVAVVMEKGWEQIVATLGILASGAAYVPIDPDLPTQRRLYLLQETQVQQILTQSWLDTTLIWPENIQRIYVDKINVSPSPKFSIETTPQDLAYVIYTSGSTGTPKGVMINHQGVVNTILDLNQRFNITAQDRILALSSLSFDLSVYDIFGTLAAGGTIIIPDADKTKEPSHWRELILQQGVTIWNSVPALMQMLLDDLPAEPIFQNSLRLVLLSGDWLPLNLPERIWNGLEEIEIISLGGATEASIWSILYSIKSISPNWKSIPYGRPMANQHFYILNENLELCPMWVTGQLYIGGKGLCIGYWQNEEKTKASFIIHPQTQERLYKTGDLGRYLSDGNIEFLGREDFQVKVNGYRIELGEIEITLKQHSAIKDAIVSVEQQQLVAYFIPEQKLESIEFKLKQLGIKELESQFIQLPKPNFDETLTQAYFQRQSYREFIDQPIILNRFSQLMSCLLQLNLPEFPLPKYRYASAGSLYPVQVYLSIKPNKIEGLEAGFYYYHPKEHQLILINSYSEINIQFYGNNQAIFEQSAFALFLIGELKAITPIYGDKARDFCLLEAGYMSQLLMEIASKEEIGLCPIGDLEFARLRDSLQLESSQILLHSFVGGKIDPAWLNQWHQPQQSTSITEQLRQFLRNKLPEYMVPSVYMLIDSIPLTANGKVDRKLLPKPDIFRLSNYPEFIAPQTNIEKAISEIWQKSLNLDKVGIYDNFFDLGGNSFLATQVLAQMRQAFQVDLKIRKFFETPRIADLALLITEKENIEKIDKIQRLSSPIVLNDISQLSEEEVERLLEKMLEEEVRNE